MKVAIIHDYITQRGGAERVLLSLSNMFPEAPIFTSFYDPTNSYAAFRDRDVRPSRLLNRLAPLRKDPRKAVAILGSVFEKLDVGLGFEVLICSTSGWAHGVKSEVPKLAYCYNPPRWLYQHQEYLQTHGPLVKIGLRFLDPKLRRRDFEAAHSVTRYVAISQVVADRISQAYLLPATVISPPVTLNPNENQLRLPGIRPGFVLSVARGRAYKNVEAVIAASKQLSGRQIVIVGRESVVNNDLSSVIYLKDLSDSHMRWLYANAAVVVSASHEDFGLTPLEGNFFGTPSALLARGGFLETTKEGLNGCFFPEPTPTLIADAIQRAIKLDRECVSQYALKRFGLENFENRIHEELKMTKERIPTAYQNEGTTS